MPATVPVLVLKVQTLPVLQVAVPVLGDQTLPVLQVAVPVLGEAVRAPVLDHLLDQGVVLIPLPVQVLEAKVHSLRVWSWWTMKICG